MSHWSTTVARAAMRARAGQYVEIPVHDVRDRMLVQIEAKAHPDLRITYNARLGVMTVELIAEGRPT